jgi:hypothetical protein
VSGSRVGSGAIVEAAFTSQSSRHCIQLRSAPALRAGQEVRRRFALSTAKLHLRIRPHESGFDATNPRTCPPCASCDEAFDGPGRAIDLGSERGRAAAAPGLPVRWRARWSGRVLLRGC